MHQGCVRLRQRGWEGSGGVVADIAELSVGREAYYTCELATDHQQYLSGHGESPGRWYGAGATTLGLQGEASPAQPSGGGQPGGMLRWLRRGGDQPAQVPGGLAVATQQANRAHDRERELRQHQQRRHGWLEANAHLGPQYRQVMRTLAWQRRATGWPSKPTDRV
jgi:hypothetical protein